MAKGTQEGEGVLAALRRASAAADAEWIDLSASLASSLLAIRDPGGRAVAYAALSAKLGATGDRLLPTDEARVRASFVAAPPALQQKDQQHDQELAAWHARDAANRAAADRMDRLDRLDRTRRWVAWRLAPAGAVLPVAVAAIAYGWGPLDLVSVVPSLPNLPAVSVWAMLGTVATVVVCAFMASRAERVPRAWGWAAGAVVAGMLLLVAARSLPLHIFKIGVVTSAGRSYPGVVVRLHFNGTLANLEVLRGAGTIRRGQMLNWDVDPTTFFGGR